MDGSPFLIRRDGQRRLSFAIAWFLAVPAFVLGLATILGPFVPSLFRECPLPSSCEPPPAWSVPPFVAPAMVALVALGVASIGLYRLTYRSPQLGWSLVAAIGLVLMVCGLVADGIARTEEVVLLTAVWPVAPGLIALLAARTGRRRDAGRGR